VLHCVMRLKSGLPRVALYERPSGIVREGENGGRLHALTERIRELVPLDAPLVIAGDFNDWRSKADRSLQDDLGVSGRLSGGSRAAGAHLFRRCCRCFVSTASTPVALTVVDTDVHYAYPLARLSDHAALGATFELERARSPGVAVIAA